MNFYRAVETRRADGSTGVKVVRVASFAAEFVGLRRFTVDPTTGACEIEFQDNLLVAQEYAVINKAGDVVGTLTRHVAPGIYTAQVIEAYGDAARKIIKETAAGVTGAALSFAGPIALGSGFAAIPLAK